MIRIGSLNMGDLKIGSLNAKRVMIGDLVGWEKTKKLAPWCETEVWAKAVQVGSTTKSSLYFHAEGDNISIFVDGNEVYGETKGYFPGGRSSIDVTEAGTNVTVHSVLFTGNLKKLGFVKLDNTENPVLYSVRSPLPAMKSLEGLFNKCTGLYQVTENVFSNCTEARTAFGCFMGCSSLKQLPNGLFQYCQKLYAFDFTFANCTSLEELPAGLFSGLSITNLMGAFGGCTSLKAIPAGFFDTVRVSCGFYGTFAGDTALTTIPAGLFSKATGSPNFNQTFKGCGLTALPIDTFAAEATPNSFNQTFMDCGDLEGNVPELWNLYPGVTSADHKECFSGCDLVSNYADIPTGWK